MELNPNNPVTMEMHDNWHKFCALLMVHYGLTEFEVTSDGIARMVDVLGEGGAIVADARDGRFVLRIVDVSQAQALLKTKAAAGRAH